MQNSYTDIWLVSTQLNCLVNFRFVYLMSWVSKKLGLVWESCSLSSYYCVLQFSTGKNTSLPFCHCPSVSNPVSLFLTLCPPSLSLSFCPCPSVPIYLPFCPNILVLLSLPFYPRLCFYPTVHLPLPLSLGPDSIMYKGLFMCDLPCSFWCSLPPFPWDLSTILQYGQMHNILWYLTPPSTYVKKWEEGYCSSSPIYSAHKSTGVLHEKKHEIWTYLKNTYRTNTAGSLYAYLIHNSSHMSNKHNMTWNIVPHLFWTKVNLQTNQPTK